MYHPRIETLESRRLLAADPYLLADINPDGDSFASQITELNDQVYFYADDGEHGWELWRSDGTEEGTELLVDIWPGEEGSRTSFGAELRTVLVASQNQLYFRADDGVHGKELWVSDGTETGTSLVDLLPGPDSSFAFPETALEQGGVLLWADEPVHGRELWLSEGAAENSRLLADIREGSEESELRFFVSADGVAYFSANDGVHGSELWRTDGTAEGTVLAANVDDHGDNGSVPRDLTPSPNGEALYFATRAAGAIFKLDVGSDELTRLDISPPGIGEEIPNIIGASDDAVFFWELWRPTPTVTSVNAYAADAAFNEAPTVLWRSGYSGFRFDWFDALVTDGGQLVTTYGEGRSLVGEFQGEFYFTQSTLRNGVELYRSTLPNFPHIEAPQDTRERLVADINPGEASSNPNFLGATEAALYFAAEDGVHGREIWVVPLDPPGDVNHSGATDLEDFAILKENFGRTDARWQDGDLNEDGVVDLYDFNILKADFGNGAEPAAIAAPPAATSSDLLAAAAIAEAFAGEGEE